MSLQTVLYAVIGGFLPALLWLWFWRHEDKRHPEPRRLIAIAFLAGALAVPFAIPLEKFILEEILGGQNVELVAKALPIAALAAVILWAIIEELLKFIAAYASVLTRPSVDEPIDPVIYMISAGVGFAAAENAMFLLEPILAGEMTVSFMTGNLRFMGAMLLHITASAIIGTALGFGFYKQRKIRRRIAGLGVILAITLHAIFNFLIIIKTPIGIFASFLLVWLAVIVLIVALEKVKRVHPA